MGFTRFRYFKLVSKDNIYLIIPSKKLISLETKSLNCLQKLKVRRIIYRDSTKNINYCCLLSCVQTHICDLENWFWGIFGRMVVAAPPISAFNKGFIVLL